MEKSPPELIERFDAVVARHPGVERRKMFGFPAAFVGGNLATSLYEARWVVRLGDQERDALLALPGAAPFEPMPGRQMKNFALLPGDVVADDARVDAWVERAVA